LLSSAAPHHFSNRRRCHLLHHYDNEQQTNNQPKEGRAAKMHSTVVMDDGSVDGNDGKDASATTAIMPV
jgi:hypothetical protein